MCGIAGIVYNDISEHVDSEILELMCSVIHHRGPDEFGIRTDAQVGLGMTRLSIIDVDGGSQPIHNEDETIWIVYNGEIYNYMALRVDLEKRGHTFYTSSDTEVIVHLYEEIGEECVQKLRGMFAFAIWDGNKKKLFLVRDRLGIKPLHYYFDGRCFVFGSEIKSILACKDIPRRVYYPAMINYLAYGYVPDPDTMFDGVYKLPPGSLLSCANGCVKVRKYWDINFDASEVHPEEYYIERLLEILSESVKMRLMSEVPLGAFLSGGTDSSAVVALMAEHMAEPVKTFSIGFENLKYNELQYARMVAERYGTDHHEEIVNPDAESIIMDLIRQFDEPFADSSAIPTYYVSKMAKKWVTVVLSGDGGDEIFGGYERYLDGSIAKYSSRMPKAFRKLVFYNIAKMLPEWFPGVNTLYHVSCGDDQRYLRSLSKGISTIYGDVFSQEIREKVENIDPSPVMLKYIKGMDGADPLTKKQYLDSKTYLPGDILTKVDRMSMLVSLEARVPILDHHLVEFAATIPPELRIKGMTTKYLFKKAIERLLPKEVLYRKKMGFAVPISTWIKRDWREMSYELLLGEKAMARKNFNSKFLKRLWYEHKFGRRDHSYLIWTLMVLELWFREMID